jgi:hypothetical protein
MTATLSVSYLLFLFKISMITILFLEWSLLVAYKLSFLHSYSQFLSLSHYMSVNTQVSHLFNIDRTVCVTFFDGNESVSFTIPASESVNRANYSDVYNHYRSYVFPIIASPASLTYFSINSLMSHLQLGVPVSGPVPTVTHYFSSLGMVDVIFHEGDEGTMFQIPPKDVFDMGSTYDYRSMFQFYQNYIQRLLPAPWGNSLLDASHFVHSITVSYSCESHLFSGNLHRVDYMDDVVIISDSPYGSSSDSESLPELISEPDNSLSTNEPTVIPPNKNELFIQSLLVNQGYLSLPIYFPPPTYSHTDLLICSHGLTEFPELPLHNLSLTEHHQPVVRPNLQVMQALPQTNGFH